VGEVQLAKSCLMYERLTSFIDFLTLFFMFLGWTFQNSFYWLDLSLILYHLFIYLFIYLLLLLLDIRYSFVLNTPGHLPFSLICHSNALMKLFFYSSLSLLSGGGEIFFIRLVIEENKGVRGIFYLSDRV